jgi:hypothetical protein
MDHCYICMEVVMTRPTVRPCGHDSVHYNCIIKWSGKRARCPLCNGTLNFVGLSGSTNSDLAVFEGATDFDDHEEYDSADYDYDDYEEDYWEGEEMQSVMNRRFGLGDAKVGRKPGGRR